MGEVLLGVRTGGVPPSYSEQVCSAALVRDTRRNACGLS
jgi:hypothetical protein